MAKKRSSFKVLKDNKVPLSTGERAQVMKSGAVWHGGKNGAPQAAVWKSKDSSGKTQFVTNTHRAYAKAPTLKGAIGKYHKQIKQTA